MGFLLRQRLSVTVERDLQNTHFKTKGMRIKINDKIYRLKEIESGVDSLMELVEEPQYKDGDFVVNEAGSILIFRKKDEDRIYDHALFNNVTGLSITQLFPSCSPIRRHATEEEKQELLDALAKKGKRWNEEKKCVEDIPKRKFKKGDKVVLKSGYKKSDGLIYLDVFDLFIGKPLTIKGYTDVGNVYFSDCPYIFDEDWLEPYVEELKEGDFVINKRGDILIFKKKDENKIYDHAFFNDALGLSIAQMSPSYSPIRRHATEEEKQKLLDALAKEGKRWNAEKKCVEDIPKRKFKKGDKVRIKDGVSSKTHCNIYPCFLDEMDDLIGKTMTVDRYTDDGKYVVCEETEFNFREEWLEPYVEELKEGDLAIFWDDDKNAAVIGKYGKFTAGQPFPHSNHRELIWKNAIKFESKEQYEKLLKGEM
jgi:hypothetical protein